MCPYCKNERSRVITTRRIDLTLRPLTVKTIRRLRECSSCHRRFNTYEVEDVELRKIHGRAQPKAPEPRP